MLYNLNDGLSADKCRACRRNDLKPVNGVVFEDFAAPSAAAHSTPGVEAAEAGGVHTPKTPCAGLATQPGPAVANAGQPHLPGPTAPAPKGATAAARKRQAAIVEAQELPSAPFTVGSLHNGVTGLGDESGGPPATTQPAQRRRKVQDSTAAAVIDLDDSSSEADMQARQQQAVSMADDAPATEANASRPCAGSDKR